jgi:hypothetical protein
MTPLEKFSLFVVLSMSLKLALRPFVKQYFSKKQP